jgi:excisionase family DNA binding protein
MINSNVSPSSFSNQEKLLTPSEVASLFRVDPKTVTRWAKSGKLNSVRTLGGHRRYKESEVKTLLNSITLINTESNQKLDGN